MTKFEVKRIIKQSKHKHYVYGILRKDGRPFYIGKGSGLRINCHEQEALNTSTKNLKLSIIRGFLKKNMELSYKIFGLYSCEKTSFKVESFLIRYYGRIDFRTGILTNLTDGGDPRNISEKSRLLSGKNIKKWIKDNPEKHEKYQKNATDAKQTLEHKQLKREIQLDFMKENPEKFECVMERTHFSRRTPHARKKNSERLKRYFQKEGSKEKASEVMKKWIEENPEKHKENQKLSNEGKRTTEARKKNSESRSKFIKENPDKEKERLEKMRKTMQTPEYKEKNRRKQIEIYAQKKSIISKCKKLINDNNLKDINLPDGRSSIKSWIEFKESLT